MSSAADAMREKAWQDFLTLGVPCCYSPATQAFLKQHKGTPEHAAVAEVSFSIEKIAPRLKQQLVGCCESMLSDDARCEFHHVLPAVEPHLRGLEDIVARSVTPATAVAAQKCATESKAPVVAAVTKAFEFGFCGALHDVAASAGQNLWTSLTCTDTTAPAAKVRFGRFPHMGRAVVEAVAAKLKPGIADILRDAASQMQASLLQNLVVDYDIAARTARLRWRDPDFARNLCFETLTAWYRMVVDATRAAVRSLHFDLAHLSEDACVASQRESALKRLSGALDMDRRRRERASKRMSHGQKSPPHRCVERSEPGSGSAPEDFPPYVAFQALSRDLMETKKKKEIVATLWANPRSIDGYWQLASLFRPREVEYVNDRIMDASELNIEQLRHNPTSEEAQVNLAISLEPKETVLLPDGRRMGKRALYINTLKHNPTNLGARTNLANTLADGETVRLADGRLMDRASLYLDEVNHHPTNARALTNLACITQEGESVELLDGRRLDRLGLFYEALRVEPTNARALHGTAITLFEGETIDVPDGRTMGTKALLVEAIRCGPTNAIAYSDLAAMLPAGETITLVGGRVVDAVALLLETLKLDPASWVAYRNLSKIVPSGGSVRMPDGHTMTQSDLHDKALRLLKHAEASLLQAALAQNGKTRKTRCPSETPTEHSSLLSF